VRGSTSAGSIQDGPLSAAVAATTYIGSVAVAGMGGVAVVTNEGLLFGIARDYRRLNTACMQRGPLQEFRRTGDKEVLISRSLLSS
jgi:hypothetical protein